VPGEVQVYRLSSEATRAAERKLVTWMVVWIGLIALLVVLFHIFNRQQ
jgi:hypothetical protein